MTTTNYSFGKGTWRNFEEGVEREWLISNGIGGYANLTVIGSNSRSFSGLLNASLNAPVDRYTFLANIHETLKYSEDNKIELFTNRIIPEVLEGQKYLTHFGFDAYPTYTYQVGDTIITKSIGMVYGENTTVICYSVNNGSKPVSLMITPDFTYKNLGATLSDRELQFSKTLEGDLLTLKKEHKILFKKSTGEYIDRSTYKTSMAVPTNEYINGVLYDLDTRNGLNATDSYYTPYDIEIKLDSYETKDFYFVCSTHNVNHNGFKVLKDMLARKKSLAAKLPSKDELLGRLSYSADHFIVDRNSTGYKTILAGFPWFLDWGRDTMIAFTGLTLCTHRFDDARSILLSFAKYLKNGLLPNVFPNSPKEEPIYNTMDASMWYFYAVYKYLQYDQSQEAKDFIKKEIHPVLVSIIENYQKGTDFSIHMDKDFLISGGSNMDQITWMDVKVGDWVVTPRHGKPVEINALWYNALKIMEEISDNKTYYGDLAAKVKASFEKEFWNEDEQCLYDVVGDEKDPTIRPNQVIAVALPFPIISDEKALAVTNKVYEHLYTPLGIRSLTPADERYKKQYIGRLIERDGAYHMGTSWGYITGSFITAFVKTHGRTPASMAIAKQLMMPLIDHLYDGCLGGVAEIFDGDFPCTSRGCYSQAWSVAELLRAYSEDILDLK